MLEAIIGGVTPAFKPISALKIFDLRHIAALKAVNDDQLYFHLFGYNALYIYACLLTRRGVTARLCKPCEVRRQLNEYSVILNAACYSSPGILGRSTTQKDSLIRRSIVQHDKPIMEYATSLLH